MEYWKNTTDLDLEGEVWKDIPGFENLYQASNLGRIRGLDRKIKCNSNRYKKEIFKFVKGKILKQSIDKYGYLQTTLVVRGKFYKKGTHRYVLMAFNPTDNMYNLTVNHIRGLKQLNIPEQLEWATNKEQIDHAYEIGLINYDNITRGEDIGSSKLNNNQVKEIYENKEGLTMPELSKKYNISIANISLIFEDKAWQHITRNLIKNQVFYELRKDEVLFIFTNPLNLNNKELSILFNKSSSLIRRIFKRERHSKHTNGLISNEIKWFGRYIYKSKFKDNIYYFTNIDNFIKDKKYIKKYVLMDSIRKNKNYKGWKFEHCSEEEYRKHLQNIYDQYIQNEKDKSNININNKITLDKEDNV